MTRTIRVRLMALSLLGTALGLYAAAQDDQQPQLERETLEALEDVRSRLKEVQDALVRGKVYQCCIKPGCVFCAVSRSICPCAGYLKNGQGVCPECFGGWYAGQGAVDLDKVTREPNPTGGAARILYNGQPIRLMPLSRLGTFYAGRSQALGVTPAQPEEAEKKEGPPGAKP